MEVNETYFLLNVTSIGATNVLLFSVSYFAVSNDGNFQTVYHSYLNVRVVIVRMRTYRLERGLDLFSNNTPI